MVKLGCMKCEKVLMKQLGKTRDEQSINKRKINILSVNENYTLYMQ